MASAEEAAVEAQYAARRAAHRAAANYLAKYSGSDGCISFGGSSRDAAECLLGCVVGLSAFAKLAFDAEDTNDAGAVNPVLVARTFESIELLGKLAQFFGEDSAS